MRLLKNKQGFALITSLMFTMLSLVITMTLLYMVTSGIKTSSAMKSYRSATEAAYGGVDIIIKDIINNNLSNALNMTQTEFGTQMASYVSGFSDATVVADCLQVKLTTPKRSWPTSCADVSLTANEASNDIKFKLGSSYGSAFNVYSKIVDTAEYVMEDYDPVTGQKIFITTAGNTDASGIRLLKGGVVKQGDDGNTIPSNPYMYRIEIQAERPALSIEKSKLSVLYVY